MKTWRANSGRILTEDDLDRMAEEVEHGEFDIDELVRNRRVPTDPGRASEQVNDFAFPPSPSSPAATE